MARSYRPVLRDQEFLLPPSMADWLPRGHLVWFVLDVVDQLDISTFHDRRRVGGAGRAGFDPDMLLALLLYAYAVGERSSRRIERLCVDHVAFRVLCAQDVPDHSTIARFRALNSEAFASVFAQVLRLCAGAGMVKVGTIAIDGTKIAANASRGANRRPQVVRAEAERIAAEIVADAGRVDAAEDLAASDGGGDDGGFPPQLAAGGGRGANISKALEELERQDQADACADAADEQRIKVLMEQLASGKGRTGPPPAGADPVAWAQARIEGVNRLLEQAPRGRGYEGNVARGRLLARGKRARASLAKAEEQAAQGRQDLRGRAMRARDKRDRNALARGSRGRSVNVTDPESRLMTEGSGGGSVQGYNAQLAVSDDHLILGVHISQDSNDTHCFAPTLAAAVQSLDDLGKSTEIVLADAGYFTDENLTMPGPDRLIAPGKNRDMPTETGSDPEPLPADASPKDRMRHRLKHSENAEIYKRRSATVETVIAHLKDNTGLRRFARRGIEAVTAELHLAAAVTNLRRLHTTTA